MAMSKVLQVEVVYASEDKQHIAVIKIAKGSHIEQAIQASDILKIFPEIDLRTQKVGVFGQIRQLHEVLEDGDRIEIYRPLIIDPKEMRRKKIQKKPNDG
jgi:uncharacterized protein